MDHLEAQSRRATRRQPAHRPEDGHGEGCMMDLRKSFLDLAEVAKRAPKGAPSSQLAWWAEFGARFVILAEAVDEAANELERLTRPR